MSDAERLPAPRRSTREKKQVLPFSQASPSKRKRAEDIELDAEMSELEAPSDEEVDDYVAPKKMRTTPKGKANDRGPVGLKKPRASKVVADVAKAPTRRGRKPNAGPAKAGSSVPTETKLAEDNALFNSIMNPAAALQSTVEDFLESLQQAAGPALGDLITCVLRTCGSNDIVDADRAVDYDGIVDALDDFTEVLKENEAPTYPLTSKHPMFKKFRKSLSEFLTRLVQSSAELGVLYTSDLLMTIQAWVVAMSSSHLRSFRHTATVIALEIETTLCDVAAAVEKEAELIARQREGERKRKGTKGATTAREKDLEKKAADVKDRRSKLSEFLKEFFDGVFIHRYRDLDPNIRTECVHALGEWLKKFPSYYLDGQYLRYIGWVLSDTNTHVRLEAVRALVALYAKDDFIVSLQSFTERFKPRLVEMAAGDTELAIRVAVVQVLGAIDSHGLLDDEQRAALCMLIFDADAKARRAVGHFVYGVWQEATEQRLVGKKQPSKTEKARAGLKALAMLLVQWGRALDRANEEKGDELDAEASSEGEGPSTTTASREVSVVLASNQKGRIAHAIEAIWDEIDVVRDWAALIELLLLDHSAGVDLTSGQAAPVTSRRKKAKQIPDDTLVDEAWRLDEAEEAILLEVLGAVLRKSKVDAETSKKDEADAVISDITRELIKSLPSLFVKHQTDENRIANVLLLIEVMNLDMYLEMRMITAYESLWDDVIKQLQTHSSALVLVNTIAAIRRLLNATSLQNTNNAKVLELEEELASSLRDTVGGRDELEVATFTEDEAHALGAICARLCAVVGARDMTAWMEEDEGGKQSSAWDIVGALAERGRLGYKEEELMVDRALQLLTLHIIWKTRKFMHSSPTSDDAQRLQDSLREQRDLLLDKLTEFAIGTQSNTLLGVKRAAFQNLMTLYVLFAPLPEEVEKETSLAPLSLSMTDELQYRCSGFVQAEIERYAEDLDTKRPREQEQGGVESGSSSDAAPEADKGAKLNKNRRRIDSKPEFSELKSKADLEQEYIFNSAIASFLRALRSGVIHVRHGSMLLAHYGRLGPSFDLSAKLIVDILREEGLYIGNHGLVVDVVVEALKEAYTLVLDQVAESEQHALSLAKALVPCLILRGAQLSIIRRLPGECIVSIHKTLVSWVTKKISAYESSNNKRGRSRATFFFRILLPLLTAIEPRDALAIKAHLDQEIAMLKIEISSASRAWEPYRAYEKKLVSASLRERGALGKGARGNRTAPGGNATDYVTTDTDEADIEGVAQTNGNSQEGATSPNANATMKRRIPRPRAAYGKKPAQGAIGAEIADDPIDPESPLSALPDTEGEENEDVDETGNAMRSTPKPAERAAVGMNGASGTMRDVSRPLSISRSASPSVLPPLDARNPKDTRVTRGIAGLKTKKRRLSPDVESDASDTGGVADTIADISELAQTAVPEATQSSEIVIRRKRVRH